MKAVRIPGKNNRPQPTVAFGYPYGPVGEPFSASLRALKEHELVRMSRGEHVFLRSILSVGGIYVDVNRNEIAERFYRGKCDWLLQVDTDIQFPPTLIETLLERAGSDKKILAASVPLGPPMPSCAWIHTPIPGIWASLNSSEITEEGVECDGLATAVMIVHRDVFRAIAEREGQCWFLKRPALPKLDEAKSKAAWVGQGPIEDRRYVHQGEDLSFCTRAKEAGFSSWCCKIEGLRHYKTIPLSHDFEEPEQLPEAPAAGLEAAS